LTVALLEVEESFVTGSEEETLEQCGGLRKLLMRSAMSTGTELVRDADPSSVIFHGRRVAGVVCNGRKFPARWTLDATGRQAWLAEALQLGRASMAPEVDWAREWARVDFAKVTNGEVAMTGGLDMDWRLHPDSAGPGYFLLREAAATLDTIASPRILSLATSGILAARLMYSCATGRLSEAEAIVAYKELLNHQFVASVESLRQFYPKIPNSIITRAFSRARSAATC
jgi:hypothetical protein